MYFCKKTTVLPVNIQLSPSNTLKVALFATGLSGIVAEYILSTLATYFLGNAVLQWTMILSVMLFSMGLGSRLSQFVRKNLLEVFLLIEFTLSLLVSFCVLIAYLTAAYTSFNDSLIIFSFNYEAVIIYTLSTLIGLMIGMEIPLVTRLNENYEDLRVNISNVMEKDYYGSLVGGIFFAFVGLPILGLTYTPFILGSVNLLVAFSLFAILRHMVLPHWRLSIQLAGGLTLLLLAGGVVFAEQVVSYGEQSRYLDRVIFQKQTRYQKIVLTQYKQDHWLYLNGHLQLSTFDEYLYHEPLVHTAMGLSKNPQDVLVLGGGDGCAMREVLKYPSVKNVTLVDLDPEMTRLGAEHPIFREMNQNAFDHPAVRVLNQDGFNYLEDSKDFYDVIIIDFPDPKTIDLNRLYTLEFYRLCYNQLRPNGLLITQAGSPYYATRAFKGIQKTLEAADFHTLPLHNQVMTMGEWGWLLASKEVPTEQLKAQVQQLDLGQLDLRWLNEEALLLITSFGKDWKATPEPEVNTIHNQVIYRYYKKGSWYVY